MRSQCISRLRRTSSLPTTGMLFSAWQAITQAEHPVQALRSITMPHESVVANAGQRIHPLRADLGEAGAQPAAVSQCYSHNLIVLARLDAGWQFQRLAIRSFHTDYISIRDCESLCGGGRNRTRSCPT